MNTASSVDIEPVNRELDLTVGQRLALGFGLLLLVITVFGAAVFVWYSESARAQRHYTQEIAPLARHADALERAVLYVGVSIRSYLLTPEPHRLASYQGYVESAYRQIDELLERTQATPNAPNAADIAQSARTYLEATAHMVELRKAGAVSSTDELSVMALRERALDAIHRLVEQQASDTQLALDEMSAAQDKMAGGLVALFGVGAVLCGGIAWFTTQSIRRPVRALVRVAGAMEHGNWLPALHLAPSDSTPAPQSEMRRLSRAVGAAAVAIQQRERDLEERNERIRAQNDELRQQYEQIQMQNEELQAQNEEIQTQSEELQAQTEELQLQSEELHSQNEELIQQGQELRAQSESLAEANERKNHFLGVLAHELRNPLAPISNSIFILKRVAPGSEQALRAQAVIERQTRHMIRLIDDLLDITRISQGKIRVHSEPLDLADAIRNCLEDQNATIQQSGLTLALDLPARPVRVLGDYTRLCQVFSNLLSNAIKFTKSGGTVSVSLRADDRQNQAVLEVKDTGIGLDALLMPQLFQPFSQGANAYSHTNGGLGLGLALVKALVELHGGNVSASSAGANMGSQFLVQLPLDSGTEAIEARR